MLLRLINCRFIIIIIIRVTVAAFSFNIKMLPTMRASGTKRELK